MRWRLKSRAIDVIVEASDQFEAWDHLRNRQATDFGLVVSAEPDENADPIGIHTSALMFKWHRDAEARLFIEAAIANGLPDTTAADLRTAGREP